MVSKTLLNDYFILLIVGPLAKLFDEDYFANFIFELIFIFTPLAYYFNTYLIKISIPSVKENPLTVLKTSITNKFGPNQ